MAKYQFEILNSEVANSNTTFTANSGNNGGIVVADRGLSRSVNQRVLVAKFGDGYEQRVGDGINTKDDSFEIGLTNRTAAEINKISAFLDLKTGKAFTFTVTDNAGDTNLKVVCDTYSINYVQDDIHSLTATFRRVYEP